MATKASLNRTTNLADALASTDKDKIYFPNNSHSIVMGGKEYGNAPNKIGDLTYANGIILYYTDTTHDTIIGSISLGEVSYSINQGCNRDTTFYGLSTHTTELLTFTPTTSSSAFGSQTSFNEDYTITIVCGSKTLVDQKNIQPGKTYSIDVKNYLTTGGVDFEVTIKGNISGVNTIAIYHGYTTSMAIYEANLDYTTPFIENNTYTLGTFNIEGTLTKTVHILVSNTDKNYSYEYTDNIGNTVFTSNAYSYSKLNFPSKGSGVYNIQIWVESGNLKTDVISYNIICITEDEKNSARYVAVNRAASSVYNYSTAYLFHYTCYNKGQSTASPSVTITATYDGKTTLINKQSLNVNCGEDYSYSQSFEIEAESETGTIKSTISFGNNVDIEATLNNSTSFPISSDAVFIMNAATRSNADTVPQLILNHADGDSEVDSTWTRMSMIDGMDGWTVDSDGNKCLMIPATCSVDINYAPFATMSSSGKVIEITYKVENASDYDDPVISICDDPDNDDFYGLRIKPSNITIHSYNTTDHNSYDSSQGYNLGDEKIVNMLLVITPNYKTTYGNFCILYVNGIKKCTFAYEDKDKWTLNCYIKLGSQTADLNIYSIHVYDKSFGILDALKNYYNSLTSSTEKTSNKNDDDEIINDKVELDYDKIEKSGKYNYFIVEPIGDGELPTYGMEKEYSCNCNFEMHYADDSSWDYYIKSGRLSGQGSTSMNYWRWNLRVRTDQNGKDDFEHEPKSQVGYNSTKTEDGEISYTESKTVKIFGSSSDSIKRITAKKNYASSSQSHKMGSTAAFNDLHDVVVGQNDAEARVAVLQYPAYGFIRKYNETSGEAYYECLGLFTIGPDKGDKTTFGYDGDLVNTLINLEGSNHNLRSTMFSYPWNDYMTVGTNASGDLCLGINDGAASFDAGWEIGNINDLETDSTKEGYNLDAIKSAIKVAFKNAYSVAYENNPLIIPGDAQTVNLDVPTWKKNTVKNTDAGLQIGRSYTDLEFWDVTTYHVYTLNMLGTKYIDTGVNILTDLGLTTSDVSSMTNNEKNKLFIKKRAARFKLNASNYWDINDSLFCLMFNLIFGASDNFGKNTYPYTFNSTSANPQWCWRNDDLDTIFDIDNQGKSVKTYSIEYDDFTDDNNTAYVFKGLNSAFWMLLKMAYPDECIEMGASILKAMYDKGEGTTYLDKLMSFFDKYYWSKAEEYFPRTAYNIDSEINYEEAYPNYVNGTYKVDTNPLQQALGSHYEEELYWVERRMIYCMSWFKCGMFSQYTATDLGRITFRTLVSQSLDITPAIDMYPTILQGENTTPIRSSDRVLKGEEYTTASVGGGNTNLYIPVADYLEDIGDLSTLQIDASGGVELQVGSKRLKQLIVGNSSTTIKGLSKLTVGTCPSMVKIDARNITTLTGSINLSECKRLRELYLDGSSITSFSLMNGSKIEKLSLPDTLQTFELNGIEYLTEFTYNNTSNWSDITISNCSDSLTLKILDILAESHSKLTDVVIDFKVSPNYSTITETEYNTLLSLIDNASVKTTFSGRIKVTGKTEITSAEYKKLYNNGITFIGDVTKEITLHASSTKISSGDSTQSLSVETVPADMDVIYHLYNGSTEITHTNGIATYGKVSLNIYTGAISVKEGVDGDFDINVKASMYDYQDVVSNTITITIKQVIAPTGIEISGTDTIKAIGDYNYNVTLLPEDATIGINELLIDVYELTE